MKERIASIASDGSVTYLKCPFCKHPLSEITTSNPLGLGRIEMAFCKHCFDNGKLHIMPVWDWTEFINRAEKLNDSLDVVSEICKASYDLLYDMGIKAEPKDE